MTPRALPIRAANPPTGSSGACDEPARAGEALLRLGRIFNRISPDTLWTARPGRPAELSRVMVVQAVEAEEAAGGPVTVNGVASRLTVDPSTASRLVAAAVRAGYVDRAPSPDDGRSVVLSLTPEGRLLAAEARAHQRALFEKVTAGWPDAERRAFARRFVELARVLETIRTPTGAAVG